MKHVLNTELEFITNVSPLELASEVAPLVWEALEAVRKSLGTELEFDLYLILNGHEAHFVMEPV